MKFWRVANVLQPPPQILRVATPNPPGSNAHDCTSLNESPGCKKKANFERGFNAKIRCEAVSICKKFSVIFYLSDKFLGTIHIAFKR
jgi:hypothetical protein